jgi:nicotinamide mononucleotide transporter
VSTIEIVAALFGVVGVYLNVRQNVWNWPIGIVGVALYVVVFFRERLYADMGLQVVYIVLALYGWYQWLHGGPGGSTLTVTRVTTRKLLGAVLIGIAGAWAIGHILARFTNASLPYLDASLTSASLVAQWMATRKLLENWILWIIADVIYIGMFIYKDLYPTAALYAVFTVLAVLGYVEWRRSLQPVVPAAPAIS